MKKLSISKVLKSSVFANELLNPEIIRDFEERRQNGIKVIACEGQYNERDKKYDDLGTIKNAVFVLALVETLNKNGKVMKVRKGLLGIIQNLLHTERIYRFSGFVLQPRLYNNYAEFGVDLVCLDRPNRRKGKPLNDHYLEIEKAFPFGNSVTFCLSDFSQRDKSRQILGNISYFQLDKKGTLNKKIISQTKLPAKYF